MTAEHADRKIKEILAKTHGQGKVAEQAIRTLIEKDHAFLLSLVQPYLNGIILHGIERARKATGLKDPAATAKAAAKTAPLPKTAAKQKANAEAAFSGSAVDGLMKAWAKKFESEAPQTNEPKKVSQKHLDAMSALVKNPGKIKK